MTTNEELDSSPSHSKYEGPSNDLHLNLGTRSPTCHSSWETVTPFRSHALPHKPLIEAIRVYKITYPIDKKCSCTYYGDSISVTLREVHKVHYTSSRIFESDYTTVFSVTKQVEQ